MAHGPRKITLDFGSNPSHVIYARVSVRITVRWEHRHTTLAVICVTRLLFNSNNFATSAALLEVCT